MKADGKEEMEEVEMQEVTMTKMKVFRIQMRQVLSVHSRTPIENDLRASNNFRAVIHFTVPNEEASCKWHLENQYAAKGTIKGFMTANFVIKGLNKVEHKVVKQVATKWRPSNLYTLLSYLAKERLIAKNMLLESDLVQKYDIEVENEFKAAWGLGLFEFKDSKDETELGRHVHQRYTYVLGRSKDDPKKFQFVMALKTRMLAGLDDIYAKHGTLCSDRYDIEAAGELTIHHLTDTLPISFVICLDNDSGTYRTSSEHTIRARNLISRLFQEDNSLSTPNHNWNVIAATRFPTDHQLLTQNYIQYMSCCYPQSKEQREKINT